MKRTMSRVRIERVRPAFGCDVRGRRWTLLPCLVAVALLAPPLHAQRTDTLPPAPSRGAALSDSGPRPPLTPKRAFLTSLAIPGYAQTALGRPRTAALFITVEALALTMMRKSANDLREAKRHARDSIVAGYQVDAITGRAVLDSNGLPVPTGYLPNEIGVRVAARRTHLEDWIATLAFNHLLSGAEAYVSAHLWGVGAQVQMERRMGRSFLVARVPW